MFKKIIIPITLSLTIAACSSSCASCISENVEDPTAQGVGGYSFYADVTSDAASSSSEMTMVPPLASSQVGIDECTSSCLDVVPPDSTQLHKGDNWEIFLESDFSFRKPTQPNIALSMFSKEKNLLVVLLKEPMQLTYDKYVLGSIRAFKEDGCKVVSSKEITLNDNKFTLLEVTKGNIKILNYITYKSNHGYVLSCGGPPPHDEVLNNCEPIVKQFKIK